MIDAINMESLHSNGAEQTVLGALLIDNNAFDRISDKVTPDMFFNRAHQLIARPIFAELSDGKACDVVTIADLLESREELEMAGGLAYLVELTQNTTSSANINRYADIVAGKAVARGAIHVCGELIESLQTPMGLASSDLVSRAAGSLERLTEDRAAEEMTLDATELGRRFITELDRRSRLPEGQIDGLLTGFRDLDAVLRGLCGGDLVIVAGRPAMGKTVFAMNVAEHVGRFAGPVFVFSMEMSEKQLGERQAASLSGIPVNTLKDAQLTAYHWDQLTHYTRIIKEELRMFIDFRPALTVGQVRSKCRQLSRKNGKPALIVIDYLQLMSGEGGENRNQEVTRISSGLKALAKEFGCPVMALSQLSRAVEQRPNKRPLISDLRDSGSLEQDADVILFPYRDEYYNPDSPDKGTVEMLMGKFRQGDPKPVRLAWQGECVRMCNLAHGWFPAPTIVQTRHRGGFDA